MQPTPLEELPRWWRLKGINHWQGVGDEILISGTLYLYHWWEQSCPRKECCDVCGLSISMEEPLLTLAIADWGFIPIANFHLKCCPIEIAVHNNLAVKERPHYEDLSNTNVW